MSTIPRRAVAVRRVLPTHHSHGIGSVALRGASDLAVVALGGVEQEQGMPGGRGVEDHEVVSRFGHGAGEGPTDGDLLGAA